MRKVRKAIIPVAGLGTRFLPITKTIAKEMLPVVDKPSIEYIVEEAIDSGIEQILFITNSYKKSIEDYFDRNIELEERLKQQQNIKTLEMIRATSNSADFYYKRQGKPLGTGHAIWLAKSFVGNEPFAVLYGDDIIDSEKPCLKQMIEVYEEFDCNVVCVEEVSDSMISKKGIVEYEKEGKVIKIVEKPKVTEAPSKHAVIGRYILKPEIFEELKSHSFENGEYGLTEALNLLINKQSCYAHKLQGIYYDVGDKIGYLKANIDFALKRYELKEELEFYLNSIKKS